jgi:hypothetical protein
VITVAQTPDTGTPYGGRRFLQERNGLVEIRGLDWTRWLARWLARPRLRVIKRP